MTQPTQRQIEFRMVLYSLVWDAFFLLLGIAFDRWCLR